MKITVKGQDKSCEAFEDEDQAAVESWVEGYFEEHPGAQDEKAFIDAIMPEIEDYVDETAEFAGLGRAGIRSLGNAMVRYAKQLFKEYAGGRQGDEAWGQLLGSSDDKEFDKKLKSLDQAFSKPIGKAGRIEEIAVDESVGSIVVKLDSASAAATCAVEVGKVLEGELHNERDFVRGYWNCQEYFTICVDGHQAKFLEFIKKAAAML